MELVHWRDMLTLQVVFNSIPWNSLAVKTRTLDAQLVAENDMFASDFFILCFSWLVPSVRPSPEGLFHVESVCMCREIVGLRNLIEAVGSHSE